MSDLVKALRAAVVMRELDLSELDEAYRDSSGQPLLLLFRANWTRGQKKRRWELALELDGFHKQMEAGETPDAEAVKRNRQGWLVWWGGILMTEDDDRSAWRKLWERLSTLVGKMKDTGGRRPRRLTDEEITALSESAAWEWVTATVVRRAGEYELEITKKAQGGPSVISEGPPVSPPSSNSE